MATTYRIAFDLKRRADVDVDVPDDREPLDFLADTIARELDLMRYEIQLGTDRGAIRRLGDDGRGITFTITHLDTKD